jgi:hypothetical protein
MQGVLIASVTLQAFLLLLVLFYMGYLVYAVDMDTSNYEKFYRKRKYIFFALAIYLLFAIIILALTAAAE